MQEAQIMTWSAAPAPTSFKQIAKSPFHKVELFLLLSLFIKI